MASPDEEDVSGLAALWLQSSAIRKGSMQRKSLLQWQDPKKSGHINFESLVLNAKVIEVCVHYWCPKTDGVPKTMNIDDLKFEVRQFRADLNLSTRPALVHCEAGALKAFMSLIVRRHYTVRHRVAQLKKLTCLLIFFGGMFGAQNA
ncbi:unnamed protein product [Durusdinium trenchii]|uniref:Uncharacterized protein n=2 Tax=Durusdinium trenchii TaxID=1381693 RepID=A0ABP0L770_9DINO